MISIAVFLGVFLRGTLLEFRKEFPFRLFDQPLTAVSKESGSLLSLSPPFLFLLLSLSIAEKRKEKKKQNKTKQNTKAKRQKSKKHRLTQQTILV